jgi:drug/metabolite transporter (DMT)-like permease
MRPFAYAFAFAAAAAVGNALFVFGQRRAERAANPFAFVGLVVFVCLICLAVAAVFYPMRDLGAYGRANALWIALSGVGLFVTFAGFYFLFSRYGAAYYALYAVLSVITTSVLVGAIVFRETFNGYHVASVGCAVAAVVLFALAGRS